MARKRMVSPEFYTHELLFKVDRESGFSAGLVRLGYQGLWGQCDKRGIFVWRPRVLKLAILPFDDVDFEALLGVLQAGGFVQKYVVAGKDYGIIRSFPANQSFHPSEKPSNHPHPDSYPGSIVVIPSMSPSSAGVKTPVTVTVTDTVTDAVAISPPPRHNHSVGRLTNRLQDEPRRQAVFAWLEQLPPNASPEGWASRFLAWLDGLDMPEGRPCSIAGLAKALEDFPLIENRSLSPVFIQRCVLRAERELGTGKGWTGDFLEEPAA